MAAGEVGGAPQASQPGAALMQLLLAQRKKKTPGKPPLMTPPQATGQPINGASTSTTRVGY